VASPFLNVDLAELAEEPEELYALAHAANLACGGHAGDESSMSRALDSCRLHGTRAGAHPSYPDRTGFGRARMEMSPAALAASVEAQCRALARLAQARGVTLGHAKLHGALYHAAHVDGEVARAALDGIERALGRVDVIGPPGGAIAREAARRGMRLLREGFADRGYRPDGSLVPRGERGALLDDPEAVRAQVRRLGARGDVDTLCVHGDGPHALAFARVVREELGA
jgi:UPF0271 protein